MQMTIDFNIKSKRNSARSTRSLSDREDKIAKFREVYFFDLKIAYVIEICLSNDHKYQVANKKC